MKAFANECLFLRVLLKRKILRIDRKEAESIFRNLSQEYKIIAPVEKIGKGRLSDTNLITYDEVKNFDEIEFFKKTYFSARSVLFPVRETIFEFHGNRVKEVTEGINMKPEAKVVRLDNPGYFYPVICKSKRKLL